MNVDRRKFEADTLGGRILGHRIRVTCGVYLADGHETIYKHIRKIEKSGDRLDVVTLAESLARDGELDAVGGLAYLGKIVAETPTEQ